MNKKEVLEKLEVIGFEVDEVPDFGYLFKYEGMNILFMPDDDDDDFLRFAAPNIFDVTDENRNLVLDVVNDTNMSVKYSKTCVFTNQVWAFYEHRLFGENDLEEIIEHCLLLLRATTAVFLRKIEGDDFEELNEDDE